MFKNYLKIAFRTLWRNKGYGLINILGLAIGIAGATLLLTYVNDENSYDAFHSKSERIVRPIVTQTNLETPRHIARNPAILGTTLVKELPEVVTHTSLFHEGQLNIKVNNIRFTERKHYFVDSTFLEVFDFKLLAGDKDQVLRAPYSMVVTEAQAIKFFGTSEAIDKMVTVSGIGDFKITGVLENLPTSSHLQFDIIVVPPLSGETSWMDFSPTSYLLLRPGVILDEFSIKAEALLKGRMPERLASIADVGFQKLKDIHFESSMIERDVAVNKGDKSYSRIFLVISIFLLLIAAVNYMNLATSKAVFRAREIGIRKVVGAVKKQLVFQFLLESLVITTIALIVSIGLADISMPFFNKLTGKEFDFSWATLGQYLPLLLGITLAIGVLSGVYPSFFITRFKPVEVLKGEKVSNGSFSLRRALVVFQFVLSIFMIIATLVVGNQMNYIKEKNLGFDEENLLVIDINNGTARRAFKTMRSEFESIPGVHQAAASSKVPGDWKKILELFVKVDWKNKEVNDSIRAFYMSFDEHMLETFNFKLKDGSYFSDNDQSSSTKILINETALKEFGLENPVGSVVNIRTRQGTGSFTIIGVLEDFNFQSLHTSIKPMVIGAWNNPIAPLDYFTLKIAGNTDEIIEAASKIHQKFDNRTAMEYHFLESQLEIYYETETQASAIFRIGAGLSIFIACLGLFGLASFTVQKRVKEMGIRRVLGASEWSVFFLLSSTFVRQVMIAFLLASPLAYFFMKNWLDNFTYKVGLGISVFVTAGVASLVITLLTVSHRSMKAANSNPIDSLRHE